ncbi:MAG: leucine-rich repeat domain-containing protein [Roseburia sp.]|nr:leucine-rich repeat domain-containing protein [Anaeroplasma bactoclasticum]MCM1195563.1 leucine-rich repeat domain-containing protein [Roseburia sp.]
MKKKIIFLSIFILLLAIGGVGIFYYTQTHRKDVVFAEKSKYQTYTAPAPTDGTSPVDHNSYDNLAYILWVLEHTEQYTSHTEGTAVSVGQTQTIYNHRRVNGDEQLVDTISGGLVSLGKQKYFLDNKVLIRDYISKKGDDIQWKTDEPECITKTEYMKRYGWLPNQATAYIICKETILEISEVTILENNLYSITVSLNPNEEYAPFWYQREIKTNASSVTKPVFSSIIIEYIFNNDWKIQQVNTKEKYKVTPKVAPITVDCETNITETFDYTTGEFDPLAMEFFEQYKDMVPTGDTSTEKPEENTPLSYITGSLLGGDRKEKTFDVTVNIGGQIIKGKLLLNISNLTSIIVKVSLGDLQVVYENNQVYIDYGSLKVKCDVDEISEVLQPLLAEIVMGNSSTSSSSEAFDLNQIMNDLNQAQVTETEDAVNLDLTLNLMGFNLPLVFDIHKNGDKLDLQSIESNLLIEGTEVKISIDKNESLEFIPINGEYNDLKNINFIVEDVIHILRNKRLEISFSSSYEDYIISGIAKLGLNKNDPIQVNLSIENEKLELSETVLIVYDSSYFYVNYKQMKLKLSSLELMEFIKKVLPENKALPKLDISKALETLSDIDFKTILQKLSIQDKEVYISLDLSSLIEELSILDLKIEDTEEGFSLKTNLNDIILLLDTTTDFSVDFDGSNYVDMDEYINLIDFVLKNINKESLGVHVDGIITYETYKIGVLGDIQLYLKDNSYTIEGKLIVTYLDQQVEVNIIVVGKDIYVSGLGYTIKVNLDTISETLNEITRRLGVELSKMEAPQIGIQDILSLIANIKLDSNSIEADLSSILEFIGVVGLNFSLEDTTLGLEVNNNLVQMSGSITPVEYKEIEVPKEYFDEADVLNVIDYVEDIMTMINQQYGYISFSGKYEAIEVSGKVYVDWKDTLKAKGKVQVIYEGQSLILDLIYTNETVYVAYENIKVKISEATIKELLQDKLPVLPESKPEEILTKVLEVVKELCITEDTISVLLNLGVFLEGMSETEIVLTDTLVGFDITTSLYELSLSLDVTNKEEIEVNDSEYSFVEGYIDLVEYIMSIINKESLGVHIDGIITYETYKIGVLGDIQLYLKDNSYTIEGKLIVTYLDQQVEVNIIVVGKDIYVSGLGYTIKVNLDTISETLNEITRRLGVELSKMEAPQIGIQDILSLIANIKLDSNSIEADLSSILEFIGVVGLNFSLEDTTLGLEVNNNLVQMSGSITPVEYKEIEVPKEYFDEADVLNVIDYVEDIMTMINQQYGYISFSGKYEAIEVSGKVYVDWKDTLKAKGKVQVIYEGQSLILDLIYTNETVYVAYENIKVKISEATIKELLQDKLPVLPESKPEEILTKVLEVVKELCITEDTISVLLNLGVFLEGMSETEIVLTDTLVGFDITTSLYELSLSLDVTNKEEIEVNDSEYSFVEGYIDLVEYIMSIINKESLGVELNGSFIVGSTTILYVGNIELLYNVETSAYDINALLSLSVFDITFDVLLMYKNHKIYIGFYDTIIEIHDSNIMEVVELICEKLNLDFPTFIDFTFEDLLDLCKNIQLTNNTIELNLSKYFSIFSKLKLSFTKEEFGYSLNLNQENVLNLNASVQKVEYKEINVPTSTMFKEDLSSLLDSIGCIVELASNKSLHIEMEDATTNVLINNKPLILTICASVDVLWDSDVKALCHLCLTGLGVTVQFDVSFINNTIYITISNQTIALRTDEIGDFIEEVIAILSPIVQLENPNIPSFTAIDLKDLALKITASSLEADMSKFIGKLCPILFTFYCIENKIEGLVNVSYDEKIDLSAPILISSSFVSSIPTPSVDLDKDDLLTLLSYGVDVYNLTLEKEFDLSLHTQVNTNGDVVATIDGDVYIKLLENQEFDARLKLIVYEFKDGKQIAWHQLDLEIISLTTLQSLSNDFDCAMMFATYGNNPDDLGAVVKVRSTYQGIENLIASIMKLLNLNIPFLNQSQDKKIKDLSKLFDEITVSPSQVSFVIPAELLFATMKDEAQAISITLNRNSVKKLAAIDIANLYVSYTNSRKYMKLDTLNISLLESSLGLIIPTDYASYYEISNIANLFEAFYHNALEKSFEVSGTVTLTALSIININVPVLFKVNVDETGMPIVYAHLDLTNIGIASLAMSKKNVYIYYKDNYVYIHRDDEKAKDSRKIKIHYTEFFDNIMYYLLDYSMGLPDSIITLINKTPEGDGFVDASLCVSDVSIGTEEFMFDLNMKEIADNNDLGKLLAVLASSLVAKTDELGNYVLDADGNIIFVPMITKITNFSFTAVEVINLNSKNLVLSNIKKDENNNLVVSAVSLDELDRYLADFDAQFNADEEYIYKNNTWISNGKIKHNVIFDLAETGSIIRKYGAQDKIDFPYVLNQVFSVTLEEETKYYKVLGWYLDASYLKPLDQLDQIYMANKTLVYYAKLVDVTIQMKITSLYDEEYTLITYEGADITSTIEEQYNIHKIDDIIYKYVGLFIEDTCVDLDTLTPGFYDLTVKWEEVFYPFVVQYNGAKKELKKEDNQSFLDNSYVIYKNNEYLLYDASILTPEYILSNFASLFVADDEKECFDLELIPLNDSRLENFDLITFETPREEFNTKGFYGFYIPKTEAKDISNLLPNGTYDSFEINAWVENDTYYSWSDVKAITGTHHFTAYAATKLSYFEFESKESGASVTAYTGTASTVILPEYALLSGNYLKVIEIKEQINDSKEVFSAFTENNSIATFISNESLTTIGGNAFKNCISLKTVYLSESVINIATDAFYFSKGNNWGKNAYASNLRIYFLYQSEARSSQFSGKKLLAFNDSRKYYYSVKDLLSDLRNTFVDEKNTVLTASSTILKTI